ncbi:hypothetical protein JCM6882_006186 [Rhodosporidiobolus microsporus]
MSTTQSVFAPDVLKGKVAFITGGGSGICYGIAESFMRHGANVVILGRRESVLQASATKLESTVSNGTRCLPLPADVRHASQLASAVRSVLGHPDFGRIDIVVCGAAGNFLARMEDLSVNALRTVLEIDTVGTWATVKETVEEVTKNKGSYLAISATLHYKATPLQAHVSAAKAGVDALMKCVAVEYGPRGVRANVIAPGPIEGTEGVARLVPDEVKSRSITQIPLQRYGTVSDIADAAVYLSSDAAKYVTGTVLVVDGGQHHMAAGMGALPYPEAFLPGAPAVARLKVSKRLVAREGTRWIEEEIDDHRSGKIVVQLNGRINKCGVISLRFNIRLPEIEKWVSTLLPARSFGYIILVRFLSAPFLLTLPTGV